MKPTPFSLEGYAKWHDARCASDRPLLDNLAALREKMQKEALPDLAVLHLLLIYMFTYAVNEYRRTHTQDVTYKTPLAEALSPNPPPGRYDSLFKSIDSIVNKM